MRRKRAAVGTDPWLALGTGAGNGAAEAGAGGGAEKEGAGGAEAAERELQEAAAGGEGGQDAGETVFSGELVVGLRVRPWRGRDIPECLCWATKPVLLQKKTAIGSAQAEFYLGLI